MLAETALELGPFNLPVWLLAAIIGFALSMLVPRLLFREDRAVLLMIQDALTTAVLVGFVVWKLTPLAARFAEIVSAPIRLLYYPGGPAGLFAGITGGLLTGSLSFLRKVRAGEDVQISAGRTILLMSIVVGLILLPVGLVNVIPVGSDSAHAANVEEIMATASGRPAVIVFWATWCGPCTAQMPELQRFHDEFGDSVLLTAVNLTMTEAGTDAVQQYLSDNALRLPVAFDTSGSLQRAFAVRATPTTVILNADGVETNRRTGAVTAAWIERRVLPLLN